MAFHERKYADLLLRLAGMMLLALAFFVGRHLFGGADPAARTKPSAYLLALIFITSLSPGAAMASLGRHLFDQVELSARWTIHSPAQRARDRSARLRAGDAQ